MTRFDSRLTVAPTAFVASFTAQPPSDPSQAITLPSTTTSLLSTITSNAYQMTTPGTSQSTNLISETIGVSSTSMSTTKTSTSSFPIGAVVGISIALAIVTILSGIGIFFYYSRRNAQRAMEDRFAIGAPSGYEFETFTRDEDKFCSETVITETTCDEVPCGAIRTPL